MNWSSKKDSISLVSGHICVSVILKPERAYHASQSQLLSPKVPFQPIAKLYESESKVSFCGPPVSSGEKMCWYTFSGHSNASRSQGEPGSCSQMAPNEPLT